MGDQLGQLKDEHPNDIIIDFVGIAPKTYMFRYIDVKNINDANYAPRLKGVIRHKGVPINRALVNKRSGEMDLEKCYLSSLSPNVDDLGDIVYSVCFRCDMTVWYSQNYIDFETFKHLVKPVINLDCVIVATFIRFARYLIEKDKGFNAGVIRLTPAISRSINKTRWWQTGKRVWLKSIKVSVPRGHFILNKT